MFSIIKIGPVGLPLAVLGILLGLLAGRFALFTMKTEKKLARQVSDDFLTALIAGIIAWKASVLFSDFSVISENPLLILYAPGSLIGILLGFAASLIYLSYRLFRLNKERTTKGFKKFLEHTTFFSVALVIFLLFTGIGSLLMSSGNQNNVKNLSLEVEQYQGEAIRLSDSEQPVIILNFWASWCMPCRAEIPELNRFYKELNRDKAAFFAVNLTQSEESMDKLSRFIKETEISFPILLDTNGSLSEEFQVSSIPTSFIISQKGSLIASHQGVVTRAWLKQYIK